MPGLYIHIPFCKSRCAYCDFYSQTQLSYKDAYLRAVVRELELRKDYLGDEAIDTIYFGGGTPSLLGHGDFELVFDAITRFFAISPHPEITLEANPDDLTTGYIAALRQFPFNRLSIGVQSLRDDDLRLLNRRHSARQALDAIARCQEAGYANLSIDLIYGLPGQTPEMWEANLDTALGLQLPHLSAYCLTYEEGTALHRQLQAGAIKPLDEDTGIRLFERLVDKLEQAGYVHYEISNFCRPGFFARHNTAYWTDRPYLGIGAAAHSYDYRSRQWNIASIQDYIEGVTHGRLPVEKEIIDERMRYNDYVLTHLRTMWGIELPAFVALFGPQRLAFLLERIAPFEQSGLVNICEQNIIITKCGLSLADGIIRDLIAL